MGYIVLSKNDAVVFRGTEEEVCDKFEKEKLYKDFYSRHPSGDRTRLEKSEWFAWIFYDYRIVRSDKFQEGGM